MDKRSIVEDLAKKRVVEGIIEKIVGEGAGANEQDLAQDIYLDLLSKDEDKIVKMAESEKELRYFLARMAMNNICSKTSPFYYKYKKNTNYVDIEGIVDTI